MSNIPPNVHISNHPCLRAKLSQLRSHTTNAKETNALVNEMALILGTEALSALKVTYSGIVSPPLGVNSGADDSQTDELVVFLRINPLWDLIFQWRLSPLQASP